MKNAHNTSSSNSSVRFIFYGGRASLDFANTLRRRKDPFHPTVDLLSDSIAFTEWISLCRKKTTWAKKLPTLQTNSSLIHNAEISNLRQAIINLAECYLTPNQPKATDKFTTPLETINKWAHSLPHPHLEVATQSNDFLLSPNLTLQQVMGFIAYDAILLLGSSDKNQLKECAHKRCGILFEDRSNGMKRQWCSMKECGNRMKVHRYTQSQYPNA